MLTKTDSRTTNFPLKQLLCNGAQIGKLLLITGVALAGIAFISVGVLGYFQIISNVIGVSQLGLIGVGAILELSVVGTAVYLHCCRRNPKRDTGRKPKGFLLSPYSIPKTFRFGINHLTNGAWSTPNPGFDRATLLKKEGDVKFSEGNSTTTLKVIFLGDIVV